MVRVRVASVVVVDESPDPFLEVFRGMEISACEKASRQDAEPKLDLVEPRAMLGSEVEDMLVVGIGEKGASLLASLERLRIDGEVAKAANGLADIETPVGVEIVEDPVVAFHLGQFVDDMSEVCGEVLAGSRHAKVPNHLAGGNDERTDQCPRAVADVFVFAPLRLAGLRRLRGILALENLHPGLLVGADHQSSLLVELRRLDVKARDGFGLGLEIGVMARLAKTWP